MLNEKYFNEVESVMNDKDFIKVLSSANKTFCSLSNILRNLQTKDGWANGGSALFNRLGLPEDRKLTVAKFAQYVNTRINDKTEETEYIVTIKKFETEKKTVKDSDGIEYTIKVNKKDNNGNDIYTLKETVIRTWTVRNFARLVLQGQYK